MENDDNGDMDWDAPHDAPEENPANPIEPPEHADQIPRNADGSLDGGVAVGLETSKSAASECELVSPAVAVESGTISTSELV
jgi:hypothetical protein